MRRMKLYGIVEYLRSVGFYHDTFDIEEEGIEEILREYEIYEHLSEDELMELRRDLYELAERNEFREAVRMASGVDAVEMVEPMEIIGVV